MAPAPVTPGVPPSPSCADAPIHTPGLIQPHGALLVVDPTLGLVTHASANLAGIFGRPAAAALGRTPAEILGQDAWHGLEQAQKAALGPYVITSSWVPVRTEGGSSPWVAATASRSPCGRLCIELESRPEERNATPRRSAPNVLFTAQSVLTGLRAARSVVELCDVAARELRRLTGHDRCMVYRFAPDGHGEVVAEDRAAALESFLGLHYPAADIPPVARQLYVAQRVRAIPDVGYVPVPLLADPAHTAPPVDMTFCALRGVAPIHLEYMVNMGVRATLAVSLFGVDGGLWGMIVCHNSDRLAVPPDLRALADLVGQVTSVLLASLQSAEALADELSRERHLRAVAAALADTTRPITEALAAVTDDLLRAVAATGAVARIGGTPLTLGTAPGKSAALIDRLLAVCGPTAEASDTLAPLLPEAAALAPGIAGALVLKLPHGSNDAIVWFRPELAATVTWGGDPRHVIEQDPGTGRLSPRRSFATWQETVRGRSAPWTDTDLAAAAEIRRIVGDTFVRRAETELARLRNLDPLTGLANRRLLQERLDAVDRAAAGHDRAAAALIYIDLDRFKDVNDSLGHDAGDALLIEVARRLTASTDGRTLVARIGGDEFAILCNDVDITQAERIAATVRAALEAPFKLAGRPYRATASIGVAHTLANDLAGGVLLQAADAAMYVAKRSGGNGAAHYAEPLRAEISRRFALEQDLRGALRHRDGGGLLLHYQPVIASRTGRLEGFEALARWQHPEAGLVPPVDFIPIAEAGGLIGELGEWVLDAALDEAAGWSARLARRAPLPYVAVNVSPRQLSSGAFQARVMAALAARDLPPQVLRIEVTEAAIADVAAGRELAHLRAAGVRVSIDDFGTGYSSLSYLRRLPADVVKLDRSFLPGAKRLADLADDAVADEAFMEAVVGVAHRAGLAVVAEGVETAAQLGAAARVGADSIQGYFFAAPMPASAVHALLAAPRGTARTGWVKAAKHALAHGRHGPSVSRRVERLASV